MRPLELTGLQTLVEQPEPIEVPFDDFDFVTLIVRKDKTGILHGTPSQLFLDQGGQPVDGFPKVDRLGDKINVGLRFISAIIADSAAPPHKLWSNYPTVHRLSECASINRLRLIDASSRMYVLFMAKKIPTRHFSLVGITKY